MRPSSATSSFPEEYLKPIRDKQVAAETEITNQVKEATAESVANVEREQQMIVQRGIEVEAETKRLVAGIDRDTRTSAPGPKPRSTSSRPSTAPRSPHWTRQSVQTLGEAEPTVTQIRRDRQEQHVSDEDGRLSERRRRVPAVFAGGSAESQDVVRLFQSGPGTFWTNLDGKNPTVVADRHRRARTRYRRTKRRRRNQASDANFAYLRCRHDHQDLKKKVRMVCRGSRRR